MKTVCTTCHGAAFADGHYYQFDALVKLYNEKFAKPATTIIKMVKEKKLMESPAAFGNEIEWAYWELWHHEGRRARHGASMMGPDYTHWHGTYDVAKTFYTHFVPELRELAQHGFKSNDAERVEAARKLQDKLDEVLNSDDHKWYLGKLDPEEAARRKKAAEEFKARYKD